MKESLAGEAPRRSRLLPGLILLLALKLALIPWVQSGGEEVESEVGMLAFAYYGCDLGLLGGSLVGLFHWRHGGMVWKALLLGVITTWMVVVDSHNGLTWMDSIRGVLRWVSPLLFGLYLVEAKPGLRPVLARRWIWVLISLVAFLTVVGFLVLPNSSENNQDFWPTYFGGQHTTGYVVIVAGLSAWVLAQRAEISKIGRIAWQIALSVLLVFMTAIGWNMNTAALCVLIFVVASLIRYRWSLSGLSIYFLALNVALFAIVVFGAEVVSDMAASGRIGVYRERLVILVLRDWTDLLMGTGGGSDLMLTQVWWWEEKGSHNDLLTLVFEYGLGMLALQLAYWGALFQGFRSRASRCLLAALFFSSIVSNGIMTRPPVAYLGMLLAYLLSRYDETPEAHPGKRTLRAKGGA